MARVKRNTQLSKKELKQLTLWGGLLLIILLVLVYGLVRTGAIIPVGNGVASHATGGIHGSASNSQP
ncbi:MAG TPA: hypothetical protein VNZ47_02060 [Candidatus Dormibacteraeota bacterium]|jgi:hypothetical protein|nr:hypothetical protein [Candidatus Dormibacteraeota bacterium]